MFRQGTGSRRPSRGHSCHYRGTLATFPGSEATDSAILIAGFASCTTEPGVPVHAISHPSEALLWAPAGQRREPGILRLLTLPAPALRGQGVAGKGPVCQDSWLHLLPPTGAPRQSQLEPVVWGLHIIPAATETCPGQDLMRLCSAGRILLLSPNITASWWGGPGHRHDE